MPSLDEILAQGSKSFRRLNPSVAGALSVGPTHKAKPKPPAPLASPVSHPEPKPNLGQPLERWIPPEDTGARSAVKRPHVHIYLHRVRRLDKDNRYASVKPVLDALRHSGLIADDTDDDIDLTVTPVRVKHLKDEGTGIAITYS